MRQSVILIVAAAALSGCATPIDAPLSSTFGQAWASMDHQIIPTTVSDAPPESSGQRGADAVRRYHRGEVKRTEAQTTSTLSVNVVPSAPGK